MSSYERLPWPDLPNRPVTIDDVTSELHVIIAACRDRASLLYAA